MSAGQPMMLPDFSISYETPEICAICHALTDKRYMVDGLDVKLCDKHKPLAEAPKPRRSKDDTGQMSLF